MKRLFIWAVAFLVAMGAFSPAAPAAPLTYPIQTSDPWPVPEAPDPTAPSWLLYDDSAGAVIDGANRDEERAMASVTKIMTGLLVLENAEMTEMVTVSANAAATGEKEIDLVAGETVSVGDLFRALMIHSANDAATALAEHVSGSVSEFVDLMNQRAAELGLEHTSFNNPHGLDGPNHFTTVNDLLVMTKVAMEFPEFVETVRMQSFVFPPDPEGTVRLAESTNLMLGDYPGMMGVKTGFTNRALLTFVAAAERDGRRIYVILLGSEGRRGHFADAEPLLNFAFEEMPYYQMLSSRMPYQSPMPHVAPEPLVVSRDAEAFVHLAAQGIFLDPPSPVAGTDLPDPPPIVVETVAPARGPSSIWDVFTFWLDRGE